MVCLTKWEQMPIRLDSSKAKQIPLFMLQQCLQKCGIDRNLRPSPAAVLLLPTVRNRFFKSTCLHRRFRIWALRSPAFSASFSAG
jgi:hypothetical protein